MLLVGRDINIDKKHLLCRKCDWEGSAKNLITGLLRVTRSDIFLYAYRCPECGSFDVRARGKLLEFRSRIESITHPSDRRSEDAESAEVARAMEDQNWA